MPDLEDLIRETLYEQYRAALPTGRLLERARARQHRNRITTAAVATLIIVVTAVPAYLLTRDAAGDDALSYSAVPSAEQGELEDSMFKVTPPLFVPVHGPALVPPKPPCEAGDIAARAELRRSPDGIVGVVVMRASGCAIPMEPGPSTLLDASGRRLDVSLGKSGLTPGGNGRPDAAFFAGEAAWGFAWLGPWCGAPAAAVVLPLSNGSGRGAADSSLKVELSGPSPSCTGAQDTRLIRGSPGALGQPVLPPPRAWSGLEAELEVPNTSDYLDHLAVTFTNHGDQDVVLSPCAPYTIAGEYRYADGSRYTFASGELPCGAVIPAGGERRLNLAPAPLSADDDPRPAASLTLRFGIGGVAAPSVTIPAA